MLTHSDCPLALWGEIVSSINGCFTFNLNGFYTLFEFLQRKQILQTSEEQSRLLQKVPDVIADVGEVEFLSEDIKDDKKGDESSPISIPNGSSETPCHKWEGNGITSGTIDTWDCDELSTFNSSPALRITFVTFWLSESSMLNEK